MGGEGLLEFADLRYARADELLQAAELSRNWYTYAGYLLYPGIYLGAVLGYLFYEHLDLAGKSWLLADMACPFLLAVVWGGRSPILALLLLLVAAGVVRTLSYKSFLPQGAGLRFFGLTAVAVFLVYTNIVWFVRLELTGSTAQIALDHAAHIWGVQANDWLVNVAHELGMADALVAATGLYFYLFQAPSITERIFAMDQVPQLWGGHQVDIFAAAFRMFEPTREMLAEGYGKLLEANVYGFLTGAWGSLYIDLWVLAIPFVALWGLLSGATFGRARSHGRLSDTVLYVYLFYAMLITPMSGPLGLANSFSIFLYFAAFWLWSTARLQRGTPYRMVDIAHMPPAHGHR